jgi:DNA-binding transcriptional ArsR family regulator
MRLDGLVASRRVGKQVFYKIKDERLLELMKSLYTIFCK